MRCSFVAAGLEEVKYQFFALALTVEKEDSPRTLKKDAMLPPTSVRRDSRRIRGVSGNLVVQTVL